MLNYQNLVNLLNKIKNGQKHVFILIQINGYKLFREQLYKTVD